MSEKLHCSGCGTPIPPSKGGRQRKWCSERCRKTTLYSRTCIDCGATINTDGSVADASVRCIKCNGSHCRRMSREWILDSITEWVRLFGTPPSSADWNPSHARSNGMEWKARRYVETGRPWPSVSLCQLHFGSWNAGLEAAGYDPIAPGEYRDGRTIRDISRSREPTWSKNKVLAAIDAWCDHNGAPPSSTEWRLAGPGHPCAQVVSKRFGSWTSAIESWFDHRFPDAQEEEAAA